MNIDPYLEQVSKIIFDRKRHTLGGCYVLADKGWLLIPDEKRGITDPSFVCKLTRQDILDGLLTSKWNCIANRIHQLIEKGILCKPPQKSLSSNQDSSETAS